MSALVEDLLLLARLDAGRPRDTARVDLARLAIDAPSDGRVGGSDHRWQLERPDDAVLVRGDEQRLHQVLANLLSNARTHTPAGTTVTVALGSSPGARADAGHSAAGRGATGRGAGRGNGAGPGTAELTVTDDGPGIPAELQPAVFERFVRGDSSRSREAGSTGLGLSIVAAVVAAHRGTVTVSHQAGQSRFVIALPLLDDPGGPAR